MSVLNRDDFINSINTIVGTDTSDNALKFIEDMTDTYNSLEEQANGDGENWKQKYQELDNSWKEKYKRRFFSGNGRSNMPTPDVPDEEHETTYSDLFK